MATKKTVGDRLATWWRKLTPSQAACFVAGLGFLYLMRSHFPTDLDGWKQVAEGVGYVCGALATAGTLLHGRDPGPVPAATTRPGATAGRESASEDGNA